MFRKRAAAAGGPTADEKAMESVDADTYLSDTEDAHALESILGAALPDAESVRIFLRNSASDHLLVTIPEHHVKKSLLVGHHTVFIVATQVCPASGINMADAPPPTTVERDMNDFTALFKGLELRFQGACLPPLPTMHTFIGSPSEKTLLQQRTGLEFALSAVARSPFLSGHRIFREFATANSAFDKKNAGSSSAVAKETRRADLPVRMWHGALRLLNPPKNRTFARNLAMQEVQTQLKHYTALQTAAHDNLKATKVFTSTSKLLSTALSEAADAETTQRESSVSCAYYNAGGEGGESGTNTNKNNSTNVRLEAYDVLTRTREAADLQHEVDIARETRIRFGLLQPLRNEISYAKHLSSALSALGTIVSKHRKAVMAYEKAKMTPVVEGHQTNQAGEPIECTALREKALALQRDANIEVCALLVLEMSRWRSERTVRMAAMMQAYADMHVTLAAKDGMVWEGVSKSLPSWVPPNAELVLFGGENAINSSSIIGSAVANGTGSDNGTASDARVVVTDGSPFHPSTTTGGSFNNNSKLDETNFVSNGGGSPDDAVIEEEDREEHQISAAFDFHAENTDEMSVNKGERIERAEQAPDAEWVVAHKSNGQSGLVPKSFLKGLGSLSGGTGGEPSHHTRSGTSSVLGLDSVQSSKDQAKPKHSSLLSSITGFSKDKLHHT